jgi:CHAT domain-containing protein
MLFPGGVRLRISWYALGAVLLLIAPIEDTRPVSARVEYEHARQLFLHGDLARCQQEAELGYRRLEKRDPKAASEFLLLEADAMLWRGMYADALRVLSTRPMSAYTRGEAILERTIEGTALTRLHDFSRANERLAEAERLCAGGLNAECGGVVRARGILAVEHGQLAEARKDFLASLAFARAHRDRWLETTALVNLGVVALQSERYDEAVDWSMGAYRAAVKLDAADMAQVASGNLGWAYFELGDQEKSLALFQEAEKQAAELGDVHAEINWVTDAGHVHRDAGDLGLAADSYHRALDLAKRIDSKEDVITALEDLAHVSIDASDPDAASGYIEQVTPMLRASGNRLDALDVMLARGKIAAARREDKQAEAIFRTVEEDPESQTSMRLGSEHELARLFEREGNLNGAGRMYRTALTTFESARAQLKNEDSKLPFLANAAPIYDDYIHFMIGQVKAEEALAVADQSRARTLAQGLGLGGSDAAFRRGALSPRAVARKVGATLLFYWLGARQSYLWAVTPEKIALFTLPRATEMVRLIARYRRTLLGPQDPMEAANEDGRELYRLLVAPAAGLIRRAAPVMILADGALDQLNFETLLAPGPGRGGDSEASRGATVHYWIEDATLESAPSMEMLAAAKPARSGARNLLLIGNPVSTSEEFPSLPLFGFEMAEVEKRFGAHRATVFSGARATPATYLSSKPAQFSYIHFVAHAVASRTDPLDSAIILSGPAGSEESFKLYARDIMQHPIDAKLVTISACNGSGTRSYTGEGLVGLSWAFLRAGARNTIGALWEVSDDSTPRLMEELYQGLADGQTPAAALRRAKLDMLYAGGRFSSPFYWAPFELYTRE